jgi:arginine decarboxylase
VARALVEESIMEALDFRRAMRKVDDEFGDDWWFKVWGPEKLADEGVGRGRRLGHPQRTPSARPQPAPGTALVKLAPGFNMLDPIKATIVTPGLNLDGKFDKTGIPAPAS